MRLSAHQGHAPASTEFSCTAGELLEYRKPVQHGFHFGTLLLDIVVVQTLDPAVRRAANARESVASLVMASQGSRRISLENSEDLCPDPRNGRPRAARSHVLVFVHHETATEA